MERKTPSNGETLLFKGLWASPHAKAADPFRHPVFNTCGARRPVGRPRLSMPGVRDRIGRLCLDSVPLFGRVLREKQRGENRNAQATVWMAFKGNKHLANHLAAPLFGFNTIWPPSPQRTAE